MRAIHPDTREVGATLGGPWAVGDRVNAVKNKNALRRQKPGAIKAVRVCKHELEIHAQGQNMTMRKNVEKFGNATHMYEIQFDNGDLEQDVPNHDVFPCPVVAEVKTSAAPAPTETTGSREERV